MAKIDDLKYLSMLIGFDIKEELMTTIAASTPNDFDMQWVVNELKMRDNITPKIIKAVINRAPLPPREDCGHCRKGFIYTLNRNTMRMMNDAGVTINYPIMIPKATAHCPNCGTTKIKTAEMINERYRTEEQGWMWVILYDFAVYHLNQKIPPNSFDPAMYWKDINIYPELNEKQVWIMNMIYSNSGNTQLITTPVMNIIQKTAEQTTIPF